MEMIETTRWEHFEHQADVGVCGHGPTLEAAFEQAALALTAVVSDPVGVRPEKEVEVTCEAADRESLLVAWLNAVIFEMAVGKMLFSDFSVSIGATPDRLGLSGTLRGETVDIGRHRPAVEVKGATYTALAVAEANGGWSARCVVDV